MSKSKKPRKKKKIKQLPKEMIPEVEKDLVEVFSLIDEIGKVDFWNDTSEIFADKLIKKAQKVETKIKTKYKGHFDENELNKRTPKDFLDNLDTEE
jgi:hypothetical protein